MKMNARKLKKASTKVKRRATPPKKTARAKLITKKSQKNRQKNPRSKLTKARERFELARKEKGGAPNLERAQFLAGGIAHEFNNLLGAADGHAEWALESGALSDMRYALEVVRMACARSAQITRALQGLYQPREEEKDSFKLSALNAELVKIYGPLAERDKVSFEVELPSVKVFGSPARLAELLVNLVKNALEALAATDRAQKRLHIHGAKVGRRVRVLVEDNGAGVPEIYRENLFEPFFTTKGVLKNAVPAAPGGVASGQHGTGLGLFLSKQIAEEHAGSLQLLAPNVDWPGARFELMLPLES